MNYFGYLMEPELCGHYLALVTIPLRPSSSITKVLGPPSSKAGARARLQLYQG